MPLTEDYFRDFNKLIKLCQDNPQNIAWLRQLLIARQCDETSNPVVMQQQREIEQRLSQITCPTEKLLEIQQQLLQNVERLSQCVSTIKHSCGRIDKLIK